MYQECIRVPLQVHCRPSSWRMVLNFYSHVRRSCGLTQGCEVFQHGYVMLYCWMLYRNMKYDWNMFVGCDMIIYDLSRVIILLAGIGAGPGSILCDQFSATIEGWRAWTDARFQWRIHMEWTANDKWQLSHKMTASHKLYPVLLILILVRFFHLPCFHHIIVVYFYIFCFWFHQKTDKWQLWYRMYYDGLDVCVCVCVLCSLMVFCGPVGASHRLRYIYHRLLSLREAEFSEGSEHKETEDCPRWEIFHRLQLACLLDTLLGARRWSEGPGSRVWWWMATLHAMQTVPKSRLPRPGTPGRIGTLKEGLPGNRTNWEENKNNNPNFILRRKREHIAALQF